MEEFPKDPIADKQAYWKIMKQALARDPSCTKHMLSRTRPKLTKTEAQKVTDARNAAVFKALGL